MGKDPNLVIVAVAKTTQYRPGHIPGALQVWRSDYGAEKGKPFPFGGMMMSRSEFQGFVRGLGIDNDSTVVLYDHKYDATRLWWAFFLYGKRDCRVLDGGMQAWKKAGYDTKIFAPDTPKPGHFVAQQPRPAWLGTMYDVMQAKTNPEWAVWDTREKDEWTGANLKKGAFRKGRIPWAKFQNWKEFKVAVEGEKTPTAFKTADEISKVIDKYDMSRKKHHIFYCQSGVRTTTNIFALYLMGYDLCKLHNYDGSWIEWSYFDKNPVVTD
jgi:thiosulfate/3-mercaptopyruvate sulfurtransferase